MNTPMREAKHTYQIEN